VNIYFLAIDLLPGTMVLFYVLVFLFAAFLTICWIAFPFIVLSKFNELLKVTREISRIADKEVAALTSLKSALNETNKALQYLVDSAGLQRASPEPKEIGP
jgi:hypothetical protein